MSLPALTRKQVRQVDQIAIEQYCMPGIILMENAGRGAAEVVDRLLNQPSSTSLDRATEQIRIICGSGNNAGDGYVIARHLQLLDHDVRIVSLVDLESLQGDARTNAVIAERSGIEIRIVDSDDQVQDSLREATTIIDCLLGTGARGAPRGRFAEAVRAANAARHALRIAIDIPTGLDCDSGVANDPTFQADHTITFVAPKVGFEREHADNYVGVVHEIGIGVPRKLREQIRSWQS